MTTKARNTIAAMALPAATLLWGPAGMSAYRGIKNCRLILSAILLGLGLASRVAVADIAVSTEVITSDMPATGYILQPSISGDGRYVTFLYSVSGKGDVFVHDRATGTKRQVTLSPTDAPSNGASVNPIISTDGRYIVFKSDATNLVPSKSGIFVYDQVTQAIEWIGDSWDGHPSAISSDGRYVAYFAQLTNGDHKIFVRDRIAKTTEQLRLSIVRQGGSDNGLRISDDGRYISYMAERDLYGGGYDVFVHDRVTGINENVNVNSAGQVGNGNASALPSMSSDGRFVLFMSNSTNLVAKDTNNNSDLFVRDRSTGTTERISSSATGYTNLSADGRYVVWKGGILVVHDRVTGIDRYIFDHTAVSTYSPSISAHGRYVAYEYRSSAYSNPYQIAVADFGSPAGVLLSTKALTLTEGGTAGTYTMELASSPTANVTVNVSPNQQLSASPTQLTFTPDNWNVPQTVTVSAIEDGIAEGKHTVTISHTVSSGDPAYNGIVVAGLTIALSDAVIPVANLPVAPGSVWTQSGLPLTGTAAPGATVTVIATNLTTGTVTAVSTVAGASGAWTLTLTGLTDGHYELQPEEAGGIKGGKLTFTADITGSLRPVLLPPVAEGGVWTQADVPLRGTAPPGATVTLHIKGLHNGETSTRTVVAAADGTWSLLLPDLEDCHYELQAEVNGLFGNLLIVNVDSHAPMTTLSVGLGGGGGGASSGASVGGWNTGPVTIGLSAVDGAAGQGVARIEYSLDGGAWSVFPSTGLTLSQDGTYNFCYRSTDKAGHVEQAHCVPLMIDATAPTITPRFDAAQNLLSLDATDGLSGIASLEFSLDGGATWSSSTGAIGFPRDGVYTVRYRCRDKAGNIISGQTTVTVITLPSLVPPPDQSAVEGRAQTFTLGSFADQGSDSPWRVEIDWGDGSHHDVQTVAAPGSLGDRMHTYADNGMYTVTLKVTDAAGNTGSKSFRVAVTNVAPVIGPIAAPAAPVAVNEAVTVRADLSDPGVLDSHTATIDWGDGTAGSGSVTEANGSGSVAGTHSYAAPGLYTIKVTVTDKDGGTGSSSYRYVVVVDRNGPFVTGGGQIDLAEGAAQFDFVVNYKGQAVPSGNGQFKLTSGQFDFRSSGYDWLVATAGKAVFTGSGTINGAGDYGYLVSLIDAGSGKKGADAIRIKIWNKADGAVVYDTQPGAAETADPALLFSGGNITIHE